ncbi:MAG: carbohydrate ABC transporter permease [Lachnospiraceae bacterium]|nr:carbohydrate ABC transporter permease [Lachnospiraceae bacterium]
MKRKKISVFQIVNASILILMAVVGILPFIHMVAVAFSGGAASASNSVGLLPVDFSLEAFREALSDDSFMRSVGISALRVFLGTTITMVLTILTAYPVCFDKKEFPARTFYVVFMVITMLFSGGLLPAYILNTRLGLVNTIWALVVPGAIPIFNVIVLLNFFRNIPKEVREAAIIDGADDFLCLRKIYLPLAKPALMTLTMFCIIGHWNAWFDGLLYMRDNTLYPLQTYLQVYLSSLSDIKSQQDVVQMLSVSDRSLMYAYIVLSCIPILLVFPLLSKHIKNGLIIGSVKG